MFLAGFSRPTNRTTCYKVYIASCSVKRKRNGFLLWPPSLFQGEPSNSSKGTLDTAIFKPVTSSVIDLASPSIINKCCAGVQVYVGVGCESL